MPDTHEVRCPCCGTRLVLDAATGEILSEERPKADSEASFEQAMSEVQAGSKRREEAFAKAFEKTKRLEDLLEKKFAQAKKKAAEDKGPPRTPFDLD